MAEEEEWQKIFGLQFDDEQRQRIVQPHQIKLKKEHYPEKGTDSKLVDRIRGSIFGLATGDALGAHVEFRPRTYLQANPVTELQSGGTWGLDKGQFTDDTSMALCLATSLIVCGEFEPYDQLLRYKWWYRNGYMSSTGHCFDIGSATRQSIQEFEKRQKAFAEAHQMTLEELDVFSNPDLLHEFDVYCSREGVAGNGALMRLAPVPLFFFRDPPKAIAFAGISGEITHGDTKAYDACRYYAALIVAALHHVTKKDLLNESFYEEHKAWFGEKELHQDILHIAKGSFKKTAGYEQGIRGKGYILDALEAALWAFWADEDSFEKGALLAVSLGDDTDTTAAIYGQLAGAYYGYEQLPKKWIEQIYAHQFLTFITQWIDQRGKEWTIRQNPSIHSQPATDTHLVNTDPATHSFDKHKESFYFQSNRAAVKTSFASPIERKAINPLGQVGCVYDATQDSLTESFKVQLPWTQPSFGLRREKIAWKKGNENECQNILRFAGIDDELRLTILSNLAPPKGMASLIDYPYVIDEFTRIISYSRITRQQSFTGDPKQIPKTLQEPFTHLITGVSYGIDLIVILRLSSQQTDQIDQLLHQFCHSSANDLQLLDDPAFNHVLSTFIYSNIPFLTDQKTLQGIFKFLPTYKDQADSHWPFSYTLQPIKHFHPIASKTASQIEQVLLQLASIKKIHRTILDRQSNETVQTELRDQLDDIRTRLDKLEKQSQLEKERFGKWIRSAREKDSPADSLLFSDQKWKQLNVDIDDLVYLFHDIKKKQDFIAELHQHGFRYWNVIKHHINQQDNIETIEQKLLPSNAPSLLLCSTDFLNLNDWSLFHSLFEQLTKEKASNSSLNLIYADFSYCPWEFDRITVLPEQNRISPPRLSKPRSIVRSARSPRPSQPPDQMNILLFGRSGVGKSSLINSFLNHLHYHSYEDINVRTAPLRVRVSFDHYLSAADDENHFIRIGTCDQNENYEHSTQPITQLCKSHGFLLKEPKQSINFIDTPGFGRTKNRKDDQLLIEHILSRIINLSHLNAICVLIQPDERDLASYRSSLEDLLHIFDNQQKINIFFVFTQYLSHPIDLNEQLRIVREIVQAISSREVQVNREHIFTFDSTYFHQLSLFEHLQRVLSFEAERCRESWRLSKNEWNRFISCLARKPDPFIVHKSLQNEEFYLFEISRLVRPILETLRNSIRNLLLQCRSSSGFIQLLPRRNNHPSALCSKCTRTCQPCGPFWIAKENEHEYRNGCHTCSCLPSDHYVTDYRLEYRYSSNQGNQQMNISKDRFLDKIVQLSWFYLKAHPSHDLYALYLDRMIEEERYICTNTSSNPFNAALHGHLGDFKRSYQQKLSSMMRAHSSQTSLDIDQLIEDFKQIPVIKEQLNTATFLQKTTV